MGRRVNASRAGLALADLEQMGNDLQVILDLLADHGDDLTVGETRRVGVLARAVRDGAQAVAEQAWPPAPVTVTLAKRGYTYNPARTTTTPGETFTLSPPENI